MDAGEAAGNVEERGHYEVEAAGVAAAVKAGRDECAQIWEADLAAMVMAGKHQIEMVAAGERELVGGVGEEEAEGRGWGLGSGGWRVGFRIGPKPRALGACDEHVGASKV